MYELGVLPYGTYILDNSAGPIYAKGGSVKPFTQAADNNKKFLFYVIKRHFTEPATVLEIGSGTGQHAIYFAGKLPYLRWQTSDLPENHEGIKAWLGEVCMSNVLAPLLLDVDASPWPISSVQGVFSANTAHIMSWATVQKMIQGSSDILLSGGKFLLYGPFNYGGRYTSKSNEEFDRILRSRDPLAGIRDFESIDVVCEKHNFALVEDVAMPANNRTLVWQKT